MRFCALRPSSIGTIQRRRGLQVNPLFRACGMCLKRGPQFDRPQRRPTVRRMEPLFHCYREAILEKTGDEAVRESKRNCQQVVLGSHCLINRHCSLFCMSPWRTRNRVRRPFSPAPFGLSPVRIVPDHNQLACAFVLHCFTEWQVRIDPGQPRHSL